LRTGRSAPLNWVAIGGSWRSLWPTHGVRARTSGAGRHQDRLPLSPWNCV
jgi:hypothetical protein